MTTDSAALRQLPWNESNPDWWQLNVEDRGDIAWQWLVNEWAASLDERDRLREALERLEQAIADGYYLLSDAAVKELSRSPQRTPVALARAALAQSEKARP